MALHFGGKNNPISAYALEHLHVKVRSGTGNHLLYLGTGCILGNESGGYTGLNRLTHRYHNCAHIENSGGSQCFFIGTIYNPRFDRWINLAQGIYCFLTIINCQNICARADQFLDYR